MVFAENTTKVRLRRRAWRPLILGVRSYLRYAFRDDEKRYREEKTILKYRKKHGK